MNKLINNVTSIVVSLDKLDDVLYLIDGLRLGNFLDLIRIDDDVIVLNDPVSYPFKPISDKLIPNINNMGELILVNGTRIDPSVKIEPPVIIFPQAVIGYGCWIRPFSVIGRSCGIANVEVNRSILGDNVICAHGDYIGYSYISQNCRIGSGFKTTTTMFNGVDKRPCKIILRDGVSGEKITSVQHSHMGCILENGCLLGCNTTTMPGTYLRQGRYVPNISLGGKMPGNRASHISHSILLK